MIYKEKFNLTGNETQQNIVKEALDAIKFPWEKLNFTVMPEIGWRDLNIGKYLKSAKLHQGHHPKPAVGEFETLEGSVEGRKYVMGIFYPSNANIYIDNLLQNYPSYAKTTVSAEIAHVVDEFLPLTNEQREKIMTLLHPNGKDGHTWWEKEDYGSEYYSLVGETFMILFTRAYSNNPFEGAEDFVHDGRDVKPEDVRKIVGIERTDWKPPVEKPKDPEKPIDPPPIKPKEPVEEPKKYFTTKGSKVFHDNHTNIKGVRTYISITEAKEKGLTPCKTCKPK